MSKTSRNLRAFSWGKFSWTEMICAKKLRFFNSGPCDNDDGDPVCMLVSAPWGDNDYQSAFQGCPLCPLLPNFPTFLKKKRRETL